MKVSIDEIAKKAGVSKATVSRVINDKPDVSDKTREKIFQLMDDLNYIPNEAARNLSLGIVKTVALIVPSENPVYIDLIRRVNNSLFEKDMDLLFYISNHNPELEKKQLKRLKGKNLAGLIYLKSAESDNEILNYLSNFNFPCIIISEEELNTDYDHVYFDEREISYKCAEILIKEGHEKIAYLSTPLNLNYEKKRYDGVVKALEDYEQNLNTHNFYFPEKVTIDEGYRLTKEILESDVTAICSLSNILTFGAIKALNEKGYCDNQISMVSFAELGIVNQIGFDITTVWISNEQLSKDVMNILMRRINNNETKEKIKKKIKTNIISRNSEKLK